MSAILTIKLTTSDGITLTERSVTLQLNADEIDQALNDTVGNLLP